MVFQPHEALPGSLVWGCARVADVAPGNPAPARDAETESKAPPILVGPFLIPDNKQERGIATPAHWKHPYGSRIEQVLHETTYHRLHPAVMLVAKERINSAMVLALQWRFVSDMASICA